MGSEENTTNSEVYENQSRLKVTPPESRFYRWVLQKLIYAAGDPPVRIRLWNGTVVCGPNHRYTINILSKSAFYKLLLHPDLYFGECYMNGDLTVEGNLISFLEDLYLHRALAQQRGGGLQRRLISRIITPVRKNTLEGSKKNIYSHYDIGNEFYQLWLDTEAMQYTCAYFPTESATLEEAQRAKLDHVCKKLRIGPNDTVVEAGCGWGGLARHIARHYGARVHAYNISHEQIKFARQRAKEQGVDHLVKYIEDDYRNIKGRYDVFVSVGMLEHVGIDNFGTLNKVIHNALTPNGRGLIHSIGRNTPGQMNTWIQKRIFPGAQTPSLKQMMDIFEDGFSVLDVENLRLHYAETLRHWLQRFEDNLEQIKLMFDEKFIRAWRLYLSGSVAAFSSGQLQLFQVVFARNRDNDIPLTRDHIYR